MHDIEGFEIRPERFLADGDTVVMQGRYWGAKAHATGEPVDVQAAHVWDLKDGKAVRFQQYVDTLHFAERPGSGLSQHRAAWRDLQLLLQRHPDPPARSRKEPTWKLPHHRPSRCCRC